jgi:hypothetical protein
MVISSYILKVKFDQEDTNGIVYLWVGSKTEQEDIKLAEEIADDMFNDVSFTFIYIYFFYYHNYKTSVTAINRNI